MGSKIGKMVYSSGISGRNAETGELPNDSAQQTEHLFQNIRTFMAVAGGTPDDIIRVIRNRELNQKLYLPRIERDLRQRIAEEQTAAPRNQHLAGQPQVILDEMDRIWAERAQGRG